jgi:hypothetical protein
MKEKRRGSARRSPPSFICETGTTLESLNPTIIAGTLRIKLVRGPAIPVSKRAFREDTVLSMRMTAPSVPKGGRGKGKKKGKVALTPYLRDVK